MTARIRRADPADGPERRPLRLLHLSTRLAGGVQVIARLIEAELGAHGVESTHAVLIPEGASRAEAMAASARAARLVLTGRFDAVFAYQSAASILMGLLGPLAGTPVRASHLTAMPDGLMPRWVALDGWLGRRGGYTHIVANSRATEAAFAHYPAGYVKRIVRIPHGVSMLPASARPVDWRARLGVGEGVPLLVGTGRLAAQKDYASAIQALPRIPDAHLAIAGEGPLRGALEAEAANLKVSDRLHLVGALPREGLGDLVAAADAYLMPSVWETFGLAGVEALMAGAPVIASDLDVLREVLLVPGLPEGHVRFHPPGDARALAEAVRAALIAAPARRRRGEAGACARDHHAPQRMAGAYLDLLRRSAVRGRRIEARGLPAGAGKAS